MNTRRVLPILLISMGLAVAPFAVHAQSPAGAGSRASQPTQAGAASAQTPSQPASMQLTVRYTRPTEAQKLHNYLFDAIGPYTLIGAAAAAGINQANETPPEWGGGMKAYSERFGSNFGIALIATTTRYTLAKAFGEDTIYYRCTCTGFFPRFKHAMISTVTARRGEDGHRVFSIPSLVAPYAGTETAALAWYPGRYNAMDGFRMGNYTMAIYAVENIALEFIYGGPHTMLSHMHLGDQGKSNSNP